MLPREWSRASPRHAATTRKRVPVSGAYDAEAHFGMAVDRKVSLERLSGPCSPRKVRRGAAAPCGGAAALDGAARQALPGALPHDPAGWTHPFMVEDPHWQAAAAAAGGASHELGQPLQPREQPEASPAVPPTSPKLGASALALLRRATTWAPRTPVRRSLEETPPTALAPAPETPPVQAQHPHRQPSEASLPQEALALLEEALDGWDLDVVRLAALTDNRPLSSMGCFLFERLGLAARFCLDREKLRGFFVELERGYDDAVQYHNRLHVASVLHLTHAALRSGGLAQKAAAHLDEGDGALVTMACLLAAAAHDFEHAGRTNDFLVKTGHDRALRHNDGRVNEHHHAAASLALLQRPGLDFLAGLSREEFRRLQGLFVELILATDMASHSSILESFRAALDASEGRGFAPRSPADAVLLLQMALKCADLGHLTLNRALHLHFVQGLEAELFAQGDQEKALGLEVSFLMDREQPGAAASQVGFFEAVALPTFRSLARACPALQPMLRGAGQRDRHA
ncbi:unnamed protein product [Prorocentrum cordatum]|uniref:Phosphodiesterase n=1 Tax=Prorocentrum cordatum TaxID=2364126 RepID=A0ABN9S2L0_9DINO|nr:unnamed protein product [Polarella glacialis]